VGHPVAECAGEEQLAFVLGAAHVHESGPQGVDPQHGLEYVEEHGTRPAIGSTQPASGGGT
jgi:hypothetical protein